MTLPRFVPVDESYRLTYDETVLTPPPELSEAMREALAEPGRFDGDILTVTHVDGAGLRAGTARYGQFLAEQRTPGPRAVRALAVMGIARLGPWLVLGRRSSKVMQEPGMLEFAPSGGIERSRVLPDGSIAFADQLLAELSEELGVAQDRVGRVRPLGLVTDDVDCVIDLVCLLELQGSREDLIAAHAALGTDEYEALRFVGAEELGGWRLWPEPVSRASAAVLSSFDLTTLWAS